MNLLHVSFSVGRVARSACHRSGRRGGRCLAVDHGLSRRCHSPDWRSPTRSSRCRVGDGDAVGGSSAPPADRRPRLLSGPLVLLGLAIATYVAAEIGVSNWLVRFLEPAPLATATLALSLTWAGATVGRLLSSVISDRFDHLRFTIVCIVPMGLAIGAAVAAPTLPLSIALFTLAGVASGPVFPMIVALGGERYPERSAAVGGSLVGFAVVGSTIYPPAIGFLSVTVGLPIAMAGNAVLCLVGGGERWWPSGDPRTPAKPQCRDRRRARVAARASESGGDGGESNSPSRTLRRRPLRACPMVCRRPPGRASAPCRTVQSRAPRSGLTPDYATLIRIAAPLDDASTTRGSGGSFHAHLTA